MLWGGWVASAPLGAAVEPTEAPFPKRLGGVEQGKSARGPSRPSAGGRSTPPNATHDTPARPRRCAAFAKRLLQVCAHAPPSWAAGALLLLSEVLRAQPALWAGVQQPEEGADDEERFVDIDGDSDEEGGGGGGKEGGGKEGGEKGPARSKAAARRKGGGGGGGEEPLPPWPREGGYDMRKRCARAAGVRKGL